MQVSITARHTIVSDSMRRHAERRLQRLERVARRPARAVVLCDVQRGIRDVEARVTVFGSGQFIAHATASTLRAAFDLALARVTRQILRHRKRVRNHHAVKLDLPVRPRAARAAKAGRS